MISLVLHSQWGQPTIFARQGGYVMRCLLADPMIRRYGHIDRKDRILLNEHSFLGSKNLP